LLFLATLADCLAVYLRFRVNAVFMEADQEGTHEMVPALPAPRESKPRDVLEPAE